MAALEPAPGHNQQFYQARLAANPLFSSFIVKNINSAPFNANFAAPEVPSMVLALSAARFRISNIEDFETMATAHAGLELMAPAVDPDRFVAQDPARALLIAAVRTLYTSQEIRRDVCPNLTGARMTATLNRLYPAPAAPPVPNQQQPAGGNVADPMAAFRVAEPLANAALYANIPIETAMKLLRIIAFVQYPDFRVQGVKAIVHMMLAICKQGNITPKATTKTQQDLLRDLDIEVEINAAVIQAIFKHVSYFVTNTNIRAILEQWEAWIPEGSLRLRLMVAQASFVNLTSFVTIGRAIRLYADFPWAQIAHLYGTDFTNYEAAVGAVAGNAYYGFRRDLGVVRSTLYKNLAWVAKTLLIEINGETSLGQYRGWVRQPKDVGIVRGIIDAYIAGRNEPGEGAANGELATRVVNLVALPANADVFAL